MTTHIDSTSAERLAIDHGMAFSELPAETRAQLFGVEYAHIRTSDGGDLFLTRYGWPYLTHLLPESWYNGRRYAKVGEKLPGATGSVYRVNVQPPNMPPADLLVKFSRVGQEVPLEMATSFPDAVSPLEIANARFNGPFEEFGLVMEMRAGRFGPSSLQMWAQRPLAIYAPAEEFDLWRLGRSRGRFRANQRLLALSQDENEDRLAIELDIKREYVLVYSWVKGFNAEEMLDKGLLSPKEFDELTPRVISELRDKGFRVLDNKPKHFILRQGSRSDGLIRRKGKLAYALVDFELLERTQEYARQYKTAQRARYWHLQSRRDQAPPSDLPPGVTRQTIFGVNYVYTTTPNGGRIWAVGSDPDLVDYFLPDRWRRTPRIRLSPHNEVYRTRTRDNVHIVYRRSRVGQKPSFDPFYEHGRRLRDHGFNSPFEEVALAETLRRVGIATTYPRAIYRTGHECSAEPYLLDRRRYDSHENLLIHDPHPMPILSPDHDYYTLWGFFRGIDAQKDYRSQGHWGMIGVEDAHQQELISEKEYDQILETTRQRLARIDLCDERIDPQHCLLCFDPEGQTLRRDDGGRFDITLCIDALRAYDFGLLDENEYRRLIERVTRQIERVGCEALKLSGDHLLLSMNPDGRLRHNRLDLIEVTLCNFEFIRMKYCFINPDLPRSGG
jgi:hypothetical protein